MIEAHAQAFLALLAADVGPPPLVVYDGKVPDGATPPYVLVYFADHDPTDVSSTRITGEARRFRQWGYCHCVGGNQTAARIVAQRVRAAVLGVVPTVAGRQCFPIRREEGQPTQRDESTGLVMDKVDVYRLESIPA